VAWAEDGAWFLRLQRNAAAADEIREERPSFLKKRSKRLLFLRQRNDHALFLKRWGLDRGSGGEVKVFWFFSSQKNMLAFRLASPIPTHCLTRVPHVTVL
jgi:hypothetical protein